jgi:hypothetical protein
LPSCPTSHNYIDEYSTEDDDNGEHDAEEAFGEAEVADLPDDANIPSGTEFQRDEIEAAFTKPLHEENDHYFVHYDASDPDADEIGGLENEREPGTTSLTNFLTLLTVAPRVSNKKQHLFVDFTKSIMLTYDSYISGLEQLKQQHEVAVQVKEQKRIERDDFKKKGRGERAEKS